MRTKRTVLFSIGSLLIFVWLALLSGCSGDTATAPLGVLSVYPAENATGVEPVAQVISVAFNKPMDPATLTAGTNFSVTNGGVAIAGLITVSPDGLGMTFTPSAALAKSATFTATLKGAVKDQSGNPLGTDKVWSFQTGSVVADKTSPSIVAATPDDGSAENPTLSGISVTFNKVMNRATLTSANFSVSNGRSALAGEIIAASDNRTFTFIPAAPLPASSTLSATVSTGAQDLSGNGLSDDRKWSFKTSAAQTLPQSILPGTALSSPVLMSLAATYGQTARTALDALSSGDLDKAVQAAFAVGVDLSKLTPAAAAADPVIQAALRLGTPIVFDSSAPLTNLSSAAAAMTSAIGIGLPAKLTVAVPHGALTTQGATDIFVIDTPTATLMPGTTASTGTPSTDPDKTAGISSAAELDANAMAKAIISMIKSSIAMSMQSRSTAVVAAPASGVAKATSALPKTAAKSVAATTTAAMPPEITKKEFILRYTEFVWYPRNRSQDFLMQDTVRVQVFAGQGGTKKWVRFISQDLDNGTTDNLNPTGFLNRGALVFDHRTDLGYFMSGMRVLIENQNPEFVIFGNRSPGYHDAITWQGGPVDSTTSFDVDYVSNGSSKTWTSMEKRSYDPHEYMLETWPGVDFRWRMASAGDSGGGCCERINSWKDMFYSNFPDGDAVRDIWHVARGTDQAAYHPKVQATYSVAANETRTAKFTYTMEQTVWNPWSEAWSNHNNDYSASVSRDIYIDFKQNKVLGKELWSTNTSGNPGAYKVMQDDGDLVIYTKGKKPLWHSNTAGNPGAKLVMQSDGNLVIYSSDGRPLWASGTYGNPGAYKKMQSDGNLVIYAKDGRALWSSKTYGNPGATDNMQGDGNYVIYSKNGTPLWRSGTSGNPGATLRMDRGNLVINSKDGRTKLWSSDTYGQDGAYDVMHTDGNYVIHKAN